MTLGARLREKREPWLSSPHGSRAVDCVHHGRVVLRSADESSWIVVETDVLAVGSWRGRNNQFLTSAGHRADGRTA